MTMNRSSATALLLAACSLAGAAAPAPAPELSIALTVRETAGIARRDAIATGGVPLPRTSAITDVAELAVLDASGARVAAQLTPLARWNAPLGDETAPLKWVHVALRQDLGAVASASYVLADARGAPSAAGPGETMVQQEPGGVRVNTGELSFLIARDRLRLIEDARVNLGNGDAITVLKAGHGGGAYVLPVGGDRYRRLEDEGVEVEIESAGPQRAVVRLRGRFLLDAVTAAALDSGEPTLRTLEFEARIVAYRGRSDLGITFTVRYPERFLTSAHNGDGDVIAQEFDGLTLMLPLHTLGNPLLATLGGEDDVSLEFPDLPRATTALESVRLGPATEAYLYQDSSGGEAWADSEDGAFGTTLRGWIAGADGTSLGRGRQAAGWGDVAALGWGATVGVRHFWENYPKGLRLRGDGMVAIDLWPDRFRRDHRLQGGRQKTHELFLDLHRGQQPAVDRFRDFESPLHLEVPPAWLSETLAAGPLSVAGNVDGLDEGITATVNAVVRGAPGTDLWGERARQDLYGWRDWGDSYRDGDKDRRNFGNNEFDFGYGLLLQYLRSAVPDRRALDAAESMLRHLMDIDLYHTDRDAPAYSLGVRQHDGSGSSDHSRAPLLSHAWTRGLVTWYWMTGDPQARDAALQVGAWIDGLLDERTGELQWHAQSRSQAWAAQILTDLWELTGEERWLNMAGKLLRAEVVADQHLAGASWPCPGLDWEGDAGDRRRESASPWQNGYIAEAMGRYAFLRRLAGPPDAAVENGLMRLLDELEVCGVATPDNGRFVASDPDRDDDVYGQRYRVLVIDRVFADGSWSIEYPNNHFLTDGFAYGALLTPDPQRRARYLELATDTWRWTMGEETAPGVAAPPPTYCCPATPAKNAAMRLRFGHTYLWMMERLQETRSTSGGH